MMSDTRGAHPDGQLLSLQQLTHAAIAGDVVEIGTASGRSTATSQWTVT